MKRILIVGKGSYIGVSLRNFLEAHADYMVTELDSFGLECEKQCFVGYDAVVYVAGIAHIKETDINAPQYYAINRDLAVSVAKKAKADGVRQFVYLSSMSVYGLEEGIITPDTKPAPKSHYGKSKLQAEEGLAPLQNNNFGITILRPPMVYGENCKGNFQTVVKLVNKLPVFPKVGNHRSMIYIDNLCNYIKLCIDENRTGIFCPQNKEYVNTSVMAKTIAKEKGKRLYISRLLGFAVLMVRPFLPLAKKAFGSLVYKDMEEENTYCIVDQMTSFKNSV